MIEFIPAILLTVSGIPQTIKLLRTKKSKDISKITYIATWIAVAILVVRSHEVEDTMLFTSNLVSIITLTINLILIYKYDSK